MQRTKDRIYFIDYLRGFMILLVVLDHSMHAYSQHYANAWFFADLERSTFIDILHLHNDAIMMPFLFFISGLFVLPSLKRRGYLSFLKERFLKLVIPFCLGIFFISPVMAYYKQVIKDGSEQGFIDYWYHSYIRWQDIPFENLSQTGFWFLYLLVVLTAGLLIINAVMPKVILGIGRLTNWLCRRPVIGFCSVGLILAIVLGLSDLTWGAPWWIGFKPVFHVRGSRFIAKILFFLLGVGFSQSGLLHDHKFMDQLAGKWKFWLVLSSIVLFCYISYTLKYFDNGAYSDLPHYLFRFRNSMPQDQYQMAIGKVLPLIPGILIRTTLLAFVMLSLSITYLSLFKRLIDHPSQEWMSLAACSFGIYIFHEPIAIFLNYKMYGADIDPIVKFVITGSVSIIITWFMVAKVFLKLPGLRRIL